MYQPDRQLVVEGYNVRPFILFDEVQAGKMPQAPVEKKTQGTVVAIHLCPGHRQPMSPVQVAHAIAGKGLEGDSHARQGSRRQVLLMDGETLESLGLEPGALRENITTQGIRLASLMAGQQLQIGEVVVLQITGPCDPCARMDEIRQGLQRTLQGRRGVLARVVVGGRLAVDAPIAVDGLSA